MFWLWGEVKGNRRRRRGELEVKVPALISPKNGEIRTGHPEFVSSGKAGPAPYPEIQKLPSVYLLRLRRETDSTSDGAV
jgi:hypothetical protein